MRRVVIPYGLVYKQWQKMSAPTRTTCAFCSQQRKLCQSHVVPEWAYQPLYDEAHRMVQFPPLKPQRRRFVQKGFKSPLLCAECEQYFNDWFDKPAERYWIGQQPLVAMRGKQAAVLSGIDYPMFKLFHLSVLWRASVSGHHAFKQVNLGPHEAAIHSMLRDREPGPASKYPIVCSPIVDDHGQVCEKFNVSPRRTKLGGHTTYVFTFSGCEWFYFVSPNPMPEIAQLALTENGELPVVPRTLPEVIASIRRKR